MRHRCPSFHAPPAIIREICPLHGDSLLTVQRVILRKCRSVRSLPLAVWLLFVSCHSPSKQPVGAESRPSVRSHNAPPVPRRLNLLLVTIDTLRADHLGCYGYSAIE